jgi:hypothetical protein
MRQTRQTGLVLGNLPDLRISKTVSHSLTGERTGSYNPLVLGRMMNISSAAFDTRERVGTDWLFGSSG